MVEDIVEKSRKILYDKHVKSQIVPHALQAAHEMIQDSIFVLFEFIFSFITIKETLEMTIQAFGMKTKVWCVLIKEFPPVQIDSWATGVVPVRKPAMRVKLTVDEVPEAPVLPAEKKVRKPSKNTNRSLMPKSASAKTKTQSPSKANTALVPKESIEPISTKKKSTKISQKVVSKNLPRIGSALQSTPNFQSTNSYKASRLIGAPKTANAAEIMIIRPPQGLSQAFGGKSVGNIAKGQDLKYKLTTNLPVTNSFGKKKVASVKPLKSKAVIVGRGSSLKKESRIQKSKSKTSALNEDTSLFPSDLLPINDGFEEETRTTAPKLVYNY